MRLLSDESGSATMNFIVVSALTAILAFAFVVGSYGMRTTVVADDQDRAVTRVAEEVCAYVYGAGQDPTTAAALQSFNGGTETIDVTEPVGTPLPVKVKLSAATAAGAVPIEVTLDGIGLRWPSLECVRCRSRSTPGATARHRLRGRCRPGSRSQWKSENPSLGSARIGNGYAPDLVRTASTSRGAPSRPAVTASGWFFAVGTVYSSRAVRRAIWPRGPEN
jgi:hypothetical protein